MTVRNRKNITSIGWTPDTELILDVIGNSTRRKILAALSDEPMYFNQLSKEIGIGQQSILRHMQFLEDSGLITSYAEKSDLGARDRKYYKLNSAFSLTVALSQDTFAIKKQKMVESRYNESKKFYEKYDSTPSGTGKALTYLQSNLMEIEDEISNLESRLNDLRALKQLILKQLHQIGRESFEGHLDREVLYDIVEDRGRRKNDKSGEKEFNRKRVSRLAETLNENESHVKDAMVRISNKLEKNTTKILFGNMG